MDGAIANPNELPVASPEIRQDLNLYPVGEDAHGDPVWHLHDPLANKFYQMQERDVELLALIGQKSVQEVVDDANQFRSGNITGEEVEQLLVFLRTNNLVRGDEMQQSLYQRSLERVRQRSWWELAVRNPFFFRIPLWKPDRFLDAVLPYVSWMASRPAFFTLFVLGLLGFYLVIPQIDQFFATFLHFFNWSGLVTYLLVLLFVKVLHELGHAFTSKSMGCRVPVIGVAFMVGWPILYTDTSDAWKLPDKTRRLRIGFAGVGVELSIAVLSLFLWTVVPDGGLRSALFLLATTTWILSIFVNFNPMMRFDGYYLLSDMIGVPNMEQRSFRMAKWWLREKLFGLGMAPDEEPKRWMIMFAFSVWIYRFLLFLGIGLLVFNYFFKAAGIALFVAEIVYLIARPIFNEMKQWWQLREHMSWNGSMKRTVGAIGILLLILFVPWYSDVSAPSTYQGKSNDLYLPVPGRLIYVTENKQAGAGDLLFEFESPELSLKIQEVRHRYEELKWIRSSLGFDNRLRSETLIVESELQTQNKRLRSLVEEHGRLRVTAPFDGELVDISPEARLRDWLPSGQKLGTVVDPRDVNVTAYLAEDQLARIEEGMTATFYPDSMEFGVIDLEVRSIEFMGTPGLDNPYVASTFGGDIAVRESGRGELLTVKGHYKLKLAPVEPGLVSEQVVRGVTVIDGYAESLFDKVHRRFVAIFIRETGF